MSGKRGEPMGLQEVSELSAATILQASYVVMR